MYSKFKTVFVGLSISLTGLLPAQMAFAGANGSGGGEPIAQQFIATAERLAIFYKENPFHASLPFSADAFKQKVEVLDQSLKDENAKALLECTDTVLKNHAGIEKAALFDQSSSSIRLNRSAWRLYDKDPEGRLALITMEISGLIGLTESRYENALALVHGHAAVILSIPLDADKRGGSNATDGMRVVGQDPDQFNHITDLDVLIDGGVLGTGDAGNQRVERFLNNPAQDKEWFSSIQTAWKNNRPAFLLLAGPDGNTASISSIYPAVWSESTDEGVGIYSLFFRKYRQIYDGACVGEARKLSALDRLTNCYLESAHYAAYDTVSSAKYPTPRSSDAFAKASQDAMGKLKSGLLFFFAQDERALETAVRDNYLQNYSSLVISLYKRHVLNQTLRANGFVSSLVGPFPNTAYWIKTSAQDAPAIRSFSALKALAKLGLGFMDGGTACSLNGQKDQGPKLVPIERIRAYEHGPEKTCVSMYYWVPNEQDTELYKTMVKAGFFYEYDAKTWRLDPSSASTH